MSHSVKNMKSDSAPSLTRRRLLMTLPFMPLAMRSMAQQAGAAPVIPLIGLHNFGLRVSNVERSLDFYQGLFGAPVVSRVLERVALGVGSGSQYFTLAPTRPGEDPHISHFGLSVQNPDRYRLQMTLSQHGISRTVDSMSPSNPLNRALHSWLARLPGDSDTMLADNHELFVADRDGVVFQLLDGRSCGAGDDACGAPEPAPTAGILRLREINHMTTYVANYQLTNTFYQNLFGLEYQAYQGTFPLLGLTDGRQFLMFVGGTQDGTPQRPGRIDHASLNIEDFTAESVLQRLRDYGLSPRPDGQPAEALQYWVSTRMPDRGGAPEGTPEIYFSDPDNIHIQLQHHTYCGGSDVFGGTCT